MRESIGGGWLMTIVVLFILLFSGFLAVSINYTKAFKIKNYILNKIEYDEGYRNAKGTVDDSLIKSDGSTEADIWLYLKKVGYNGIGLKKSICNNKEFGTVAEDYKTGGYCVQKVAHGEDNTAHYKVTAFIIIELPFIDTKFTIPINGETNTMYYHLDEVN
ncbi:MAG: hypothetical protein RR228_03850 [Bacilli bacterium]